MAFSICTIAVPYHRLIVRILISVKIISKIFSFVAVVLLAFTPMAHAHEEEITQESLPLDAMTNAYRLELLRKISVAANETANKSAYFEEDMRPISIHVSYDAEKIAVVFALDDRFGKEAGWTAMNDMMQDINQRVKEVTPLLEYGRSQIWLFGGRDIDYWQPIPTPPAI